MNYQTENVFTETTNAHDHEIQRVIKSAPQFYIENSWLSLCIKNGTQRLNIGRSITDSSEEDTSSDGKVGATLIAEGNAHLVLSLETSFPAVLRLSKNKAHVGPKPFTNEFKIEFYKTVVSTLFGRSFCVSLDIIPINRTVLSLISEKVHQFRDPKRQALEINLNETTAILMENITEYSMSIPCLTIEIKPKWGFLPIYYSNQGTDSTTCRFCLHQFIKQYERKSEFCPMDLFSGEIEQVRKALLALISTPQNNFRVFQQSRAVQDVMIPQTLQAFFGASLEDVITLIAKILSETGFLRKLKEWQAYLDVNPEEIASTMRNFDLDFLDHQLLLRLEPIMQRITGKKSPEDDIEIILRFLISASLKDLSFMVRLRLISEPNEVEVDRGNPIMAWNGKYVAYELRALDVDPKTAHKLKDMAQLHQKLMSISATIDKVCISS